MRPHYPLSWGSRGPIARPASGTPCWLHRESHSGPLAPPHCSPIGPTHPPALGLSSAITPGEGAASLTHPPVQGASVSELRPSLCTSLSGPGPSGWVCPAPARPPETKSLGCALCPLSPCPFSPPTPSQCQACPGSPLSLSPPLLLGHLPRLAQRPSTLALNRDLQLNSRF